MRSLPDRPCHGETRQRAPVPVHVAVAVKDHVNVKAHVNVYEFSATQLPKSRLADRLAWIGGSGQGAMGKRSLPVPVDAPPHGQAFPRSRAARHDGLPMAPGKGFSDDL